MILLIIFILKQIKKGRIVKKDFRFIFKRLFFKKRSMSDSQRYPDNFYLINLEDKVVFLTSKVFFNSDK